VIVTRTFSKAFCLASLRVGYIIAHPNTIELLRVRYNPKVSFYFFLPHPLFLSSPFSPLISCYQSVNQLAQLAATQALEELKSYYEPYIYVTNEARKKFVDDLTQRYIFFLFLFIVIE
jgi:aspartate/methionine/tyrosine aminotransferase